MAALGKIIFLALVTVEVIVAQRCSKNEVYDECGTACPATCDQQIRPICSKQCVPGCFCRPGYIRNTKTNTCVQPETCNSTRAVRAVQQCPKNEVYDECGTACPATCDQKIRPICSKQCVPGCFCKPGFIRDTKTNTCIQPENCKTRSVRAAQPQQCPENEYYEECGTACPLKCHGKFPFWCSKECVPGCFCKVGYVRDAKTNTCLTLQACIDEMKAAQSCVENEEYLSCGTACPENCDDKEPKMCTLECKSGCFCKSGYVKDTRINKCVLRDQCSK